MSYIFISLLYYQYQVSMDRQIVTIIIDNGGYDIVLYFFLAFHSLSSSLHYFETLHKNDLHHEIKYDNMPRLKDNLREIKFTTHGR